MKPFKSWQLFPKSASKTTFQPRLQDWNLPYWFITENQPDSPDFNTCPVHFHNHSHRNWTTIRSGSNAIEVDPYGVLTLPQWGVSLETWLDTGDKVITPGRFLKVKQAYLRAVAGVRTINYCEGAYLKISCYPAGSLNRDLITLSLELNGNSDVNLRNWVILLIVRPYTHEGFTPVQHLEYRAGLLFVNHQALLNCDCEPHLACFGNIERGDVLEGYRRGEVNSQIISNDGYGTGLLGYSGLLTELKGVKLQINPPARKVPGLKKGLLMGIFLPGKNQELKEVEWPRRPIKTNLSIDPLIGDNLIHLRVFCKAQPEQYNVFQIMALNRWGAFQISLNYLEDNLKYWRSNSNSTANRLGDSRLLVAAADYYRMSGNSNFIEKNWPFLKKIGACLVRQEGNGRPLITSSQESGTVKEGYFARAFWDCAALSQVSMLARHVGELETAHFFNDEYLWKWSNLHKELNHLAKLTGSQVIPWNLSCRKGGLIAANLCAAVPLALFPIRDRHILETLALIGEQYLCQGGVVSPFDFKGIDLELTALLGRVLIRENLDFNQVLELLIKTVGPAGSWPDRVNPNTGRGIGKNGDDPLVLYQVMLLLREIFLIEEGEFLLLLPGILANHSCSHPLITIRSLSSYFGEISLQCRAVGKMIQIEFYPSYRKMPKKVLLRLGNCYRVIASDGGFYHDGAILELDPGFHYLRLERVSSEAKLDNTF